MNRTYRLFSIEHLRMLLMLSVLFLILPSGVLVVHYSQRNYDAAGGDSIGLLLGIIISVAAWISFNQTLRISDEGLTVTQPFRRLTMQWNEVTNVRVFRTSLSFTRPRRYVISAIVTDSRGRIILIHGAIPSSQEIIQTLKDRLPNVMTHARRLAGNQTLEITADGLILRNNGHHLFTAPWNEIKDVQLTQRPSRNGVTAMVRCDRGRQIRIPGTAEDSEAIIEALRTRVPSVFSDQSAASHNG